MNEEINNHLSPFTQTYVNVQGSDVYSKIYLSNSLNVYIWLAKTYITDGSH